MVIRSLTAIISARLLPIDDNNHFTSKNVVLRRAAKSIVLSNKYYRVFEPLGRPL